MVHLSTTKTIYEEEDRLGIEDFPRTALKPQKRRERIHGLGIKGVDVTPPSSSSSSSVDIRAIKPYKKNGGSKRSLVSLITKSVESHIGKHGTARASSSRPNLTTSPPVVRMSPTVWRTSNPTPNSLTPDVSTEDLTTFSINLARFKAERAERVAELGIQEFDVSQPESSMLEEIQDREIDVRKSSGLNLTRDMRAYWGGGGSSGSKQANSPRRSSNSPRKGNSSPRQDSKNSSIDTSDRVGKEMLKEWWDRLGAEPKEEVIIEGDGVPEAHEVAIYATISR